MLRRVEVRDFADSFGTTPEDVLAKCADIIEKYDFGYHSIEGEERDALILRILKHIEQDRQLIGAPERADVWKRGWAEVVEEFVASNYDLRTLVPKFIRSGQPARFKQQYIQPVSLTFELDYFSVFRQWLYKTYFAPVGDVYEFGCGTGFNLVALAQLDPDKKLHGLDFVSSSVELIARIAERYGLNLTGHVFDMTSPDRSLQLAEHCGLLTIGAVEQLAGRFEGFLNYLLSQRVSVCVHVEPTVELYDERNLVDYLAIKFQNKRGYTKNLLPYLRRMEDERKVELIKVKRLYFGSLYMEGYNLLIWRPLC